MQWTRIATSHSTVLTRCPAGARQFPSPAVHLQHNVMGSEESVANAQETSVLVLNQNFEPLNVCNCRRAMILVMCGKAEVLELRSGCEIVTTSRRLPRPSVIRMIYMIKRPRPRVRLSRREIFLRDNYTCQYCGSRSRDLTLDHVIPRHRGGRHTWDNLVSACRPCNHRKGGKTPEEARMALLHQPYQPKANGYNLFRQYFHMNIEWQKFLPHLESA